MKLINHRERKDTHHRFMIDRPYFRNEEFILKDGNWISTTDPKDLWSVGDEKGGGPYNRPKNWIELEREFKLIEIGV